MAKRSIVHIEIPAADREAATKFYGELFGWDDFQPLPFGYTYFKTGNTLGGFPELGDWQPGDVIIYISSDDIDADLNAIEARGGKILIPKSEVPNTGWFAWFSDPTGNKLALFSPNK
jgi:uncharacterized protein